MTETQPEPTPDAAEVKQENGDCKASAREEKAPREFEPPEGGWGWVVMLASMWCNGSVFGIQNAFGILFVSLLNEFGSESDEDLRFKTDSAVFSPSLNVSCVMLAEDCVMSSCPCTHQHGSVGSCQRRSEVSLQSAIRHSINHKSKRS
ncbi:monocarboxylate transporter 10-like [Sinocyclocheilus anshuiensis]|uniref:monocarboxylate transporter 10-like n=1 Tax=Sinocyclocheilus anshuiensis TaxID=1608454 RepID=UPI0007B83599|nr:PREDICTED: monocarboxylate transporter 10-like [Sinocyclocheilus anshuiensis]